MNYKMHITWGMHKHNPRKTIVTAPVGQLTPVHELPIRQHMMYIEICGRHAARTNWRERGAS